MKKLPVVAASEDVHEGRHTQSEPTSEQLARYCKALAHPTRVQILRFLQTTNACICGDIVQMLPLAQSTVSQHLKILKDAGLIQGDIDGPRTCYSINHEAVEHVKQLIMEL
ncbi:ArsR/SmtB family transcription factor [Ktedonospora formicarum]|uniref:Transcriptional regulator n=1 Tax=Ktedonospora formicarum TaxID=2778364 RepID=A0A8J3MUZ5_9CHLR|nr:metalloregulator ArsR/SmtB family transcription factor [Ktedonospora formicarum]GHO48760.1 transcriptional regulator [Ktedonospora formicarum]